MSLLGQIGEIASMGSLLLTKRILLRRDATDYPVSGLMQKTQKPYRATENRKPFDAQIRIDRVTSGIEPIQNDLVVTEEGSWIVWRIIPSPAGSHWTLECMSPPTVAAVPISFVDVPDGYGGETQAWTHMPELVFYVKTREGSVDRQLTVDTKEALNRLSIAYEVKAAPGGFDESWRLAIDGREYEILSIKNDDENPLWRNAILTREESR